jgi:hypothetical protein
MHSDKGWFNVYIVNKSSNKDEVRYGWVDSDFLTKI